MLDGGLQRSQLFYMGLIREFLFCSQLQELSVAVLVVSRLHNVQIMHVVLYEDVDFAPCVGMRDLQLAVCCG